MSAAPQRPAPTPGAEAPETGRRPSLARSFLREARPKQWVKNVLVFAAPGAAGVLTEPAQVGRTLIAFAAFCLAGIASALSIHDADAAATIPGRPRHPQWPPPAIARIWHRPAAAPHYAVPTPDEKAPGDKAAV